MTPTKTKMFEVAKVNLFRKKVTPTLYTTSLSFLYIATIRPPPTEFPFQLKKAKPLEWTQVKKADRRDEIKVWGSEF